MGRLLIEIRASIFSSFEEIQITFSSNFYWNICVKICNRPIMGVARYGLLVSDRIIMNLDGTQNNGSALIFWLSLVKFWVFVKRFRILSVVSQSPHSFGHASPVPSPACDSGVSSIHKRDDWGRTVVRGFITRPFSAGVRGKRTRDEAVRVLTWESKAPWKRTQHCWPTTPNIVGC